MNKLITILFIICISFKSNSQAYVPMPMQNCYWEMTHGNYCSQASGTPAVSTSLQVYKIYPYNDTVIATTKYIKFYLQSLSSSVSSYCSMGTVSSGYFGAVRQDTLGKKIFLISPNQTSEKLLYNFNYIKGDTVKTILGTYTASPCPACDNYRVIDSVYYQSYTDGICRKTFRQKSYFYNGGGYMWTQHHYFTEGIGNEVGFIEQNYSITTGNINYATQESWNSFLTINNFTISATTNNMCAQNVGIKTNSNTNVIKIFPNPAFNDITINLENSIINNYYFVIYDLFGNKILTTGNKIVKIDHLPIGTYIVKCSLADTKEVMVTKFIKE